MTAHGVLDFLACLGSLFFAAVALRHTAYTFVSLVRRVRTPMAAVPATRFVVMIPAHNEEAGVAATIRSARGQDYPAPLVECVVLADNCTDGTVEAAHAAGAGVAVRNDPDRMGKGPAIDWFIRSRIWDEGAALVCLDADSVADRDWLRALDARLQAGAEAVQCYNGAIPPRGSSLAELSLLTNTMKNAGTYAGKAALGFPVPLMNGWCLSARVLREIGWPSFSVTEDFEQTLRLGLQGVFAVFAPETRVRSEKARTFGDAASQRRRWSGGEAVVAKTLGRQVLAEALRRRCAKRGDLALDVLLPGYATTAAALLAIFTALMVLHPNPARDALGCVSSLLALFGVAGFIFMTVVAILRSDDVIAALKALALAPVFIVWKSAVALSARLRPPKDWQRAKRS